MFICLVWNLLVVSALNTFVFTIKFRVGTASFFFFIFSGELHGKFFDREKFSLNQISDSNIYFHKLLSIPMM